MDNPFYGGLRVAHLNYQGATITMRRFFLSLSVVAVSLIATSDQSRADDYGQKYSPWKYNAKLSRYTCNYTFKPTPYSPPKTQVVVYYPTQQRKNYLFYYNPEKKTYWGRCASPTHPQYNKNQMHWSMFQQKKWTPISQVCPSVPGSTGGPEILPPPPPPLEPPPPPGL